MAPIHLPVYDIAKAAVWKRRRLYQFVAASIVLYVVSGFPWTSEAWPWLLTLSVLWFHYWFVCARPTRIYGSLTPSRRRMLSELRCLDGRGYLPTPYLTQTDLQTICGVMGRPWPGIRYDSECVDNLLHDGEVSVFDWAWAPEGLAAKAAEPWSHLIPSFLQPIDFVTEPEKMLVPRKAPVIIIMHGLTLIGGDLTIDHLVYRMNALGWHCVVPIRRGCHDKLRVPKYYDYGGIDDVVPTVEYIAQRMKGHPLFAVGLSCGSNILTNYLALTSHHTEPRILGAISIANGFCWQTGTRWLREDHPAWEMVMAGLVQHVMHRNHPVMLADDAHARRRRSWETSPALNRGANSDFHSVEPAAHPSKYHVTFEALDEHVTRRQHGYATLDEFYAAQSSKPRLHKIRTPTLFLNAEDDKLASNKGWPVETLVENPNTIFVTTPSGGHLGWHQGWFPHRKSANTFLDDFVVQGLKGLMLEAMHRICNPTRADR